MESEHPYNPNGKYSFDTTYDDSTLLDETTEKIGKRTVRKAIAYDLFAKNHNGVNINRKKFCDGFRRLFVKLNDRIVKMHTGNKKHNKAVNIEPLTIYNFKATSFDLIRVYNNETGCVTEALFPVDFESINPVTIDDKAYKVTINMDNPTALGAYNMEGGPQGTHFGYSIKPVAKGSEVLAHVLINTFVGFPSRNKKVSDDIKYLSKQEGIQHFKFSELNNIITNPNYVIPYDLISTKGLVEALKEHPATLEPTFPEFQVYWK